MSGPIHIPEARGSDFPSDPDPSLLRPDVAPRPDMAGRPGRLSVSGSSAITRRITLVAVLVGIVLALGKTIVFLQSGSVGVLASLVHSALDMTGAVGSFVAVRFAARAPSGEYSYGRGKAEGFAAVFQVCLIVLAAFHLFQESAFHLFGLEGGHDHGHGVGEGIRNVGFAATAMAALVGLTIWLVIAQTWAVRATGSLAVRGDRAHYLADALANIAVILGLVAASVTGVEGIDAAVGVGFSVWLLWAAWRVARLAWNQLMDVELPEDERAYLGTLAGMDARVRALRSLRTRAAGPHAHIEMVVDLADGLSLTEAHAVCVGVERRVRGVYRAAQVSVSPHPVACDAGH